MSLFLKTELGYFLIYFLIEGGGKAILEFLFFSRFLKSESRSRHFLAYMLVLYGLSFLEVKVGNYELSLLFMAGNAAILFLFGIWIYKRRWSDCLLGAVLTVMVMMISNGMTAPVSLLLVPFGRAAENFMEISGVLILIFVLLFALFTYRLILEKFGAISSLPKEYLVIFMIPVLLLVILESYIMTCVYGSQIVIEDFQVVYPVANHWQMLLFQLFSYFSLLCILYACSRLAVDFYNRTRLALLEAETHYQMKYVEEAKTRYEQTRRFRHDIKSHLTVLSGLLQSGKIKRARNYLKGLKGSCACLSIPCQTGNPVLDILICSKAETAALAGIEVDFSSCIAPPGPVDDLDLCVIFSNGLDNAIKGCGDSHEGHQFIRISGRIQGDFYTLTLINSRPENGGYEKGQGLGLENIRGAAAKYRGAVSTELTACQFRLDVLLVISRQPEDIS